MNPRDLPWWKPTTKTWLHVAFSLPLIALVLRGAGDYYGFDFLGGLGANPIEAGIRNLGDWALRILMIALAVTPARRLLRRPEIGRYRRMIGLWAFAYVCLHLIGFIVVDQGFDWNNIWKEIVKNKFITVGMAAFLVMLPLAITSTNGMIRRMGAAQWRNLHKLVYVAGICGAVHYLWMAKAIKLHPGFDAFLTYLWLVISKVHQPPIYATIIALLLAARLWWWWQRQRATAMAAAARPAQRIG